MTPHSRYTAEEQTTLLNIAHRSIEHGLTNDAPAPVCLVDHAPTLQALRASFVTLKIAYDLRGCIGTLEAIRPLAEDVSHNAYAAAFRDPRFSPLRASELDKISISLSILSTPALLSFESEQDLIEQLRPGVDGLILEVSRQQRGTFLPAVWEALPNPTAFLSQLKLKAGLPVDYWSETLRVYRYTAAHIGAE